MNDGKLPRSEKGHIPGLEPEPADEYVHQEYPKAIGDVIVHSEEEEAELARPEDKLAEVWKDSRPVDDEAVEEEI